VSSHRRSIDIIGIVIFVDFLTYMLGLGHYFCVSECLVLGYGGGGSYIFVHSRSCAMNVRCVVLVECIARPCVVCDRGCCFQFL